jgi:hypothetical protein
VHYDDLRAVEETDRDPDAETREDIIRYRSQSGLPVDDATVEWFLAESKAGRQDSGRWLTEAEARESDRLEDLVEDVRAAVSPYLDRHRADVAGQWLEYGRGAYHVGFARNVESHRDALARHVPQPGVLHVHAFEYAEAELEAIADRVVDEADELAAEGLAWMGSDIDVQANRVEVEVAGADADTATAILMSRFGPAVKCDWQGPEDTRVTPVAWQLWTIDESERLLTAHFGTWAAAKVERAECEEDADEVRVTVFVRLPGSMKTIGGHFEATVELAQPLGQRRVVDGLTGRVRQRRVTRELLERSWQLVRDYGAEHPAEYAGSWAEHPGCHAAFTANVEGHREALEELLPAPRVLVVEKAERSLAELEAMEQQILREKRALRSHGIKCFFVAIHIEDNAVFIEIEAKDNDAARRLIADRYGPGVNVMTIG